MRPDAAEWVLSEVGGVAGVVKNEETPSFIFLFRVFSQYL